MERQDCRTPRRWRERQSPSDFKAAAYPNSIGRPAGANFQSLPRIPATPRAKFAEAGRLGQNPGRVRSPKAGATQVLAQQSTPRLSLCGGEFRLRSNA